MWDEVWGCPIKSGMTIVEEIPRLAALARNDRKALGMTVFSFRMTAMAMFRMVVEVLARGAVVVAGRFVVAAADGSLQADSFQ